MEPVTMELQEDMVMIIIGDNGDDVQPKEIKKEAADVDDNDSENVEYLLERAEKYGEMIPMRSIKHETEDNDSDELSQTGTDEGSEYLEDFSSSDEELLIEKIKKEKVKTETRKRRNANSQEPAPNIFVHPRRRRMLKSYERKSYVWDLKKENPELRKSEELLVEALVKKMNETKPPPPPDDFCEIDQANPDGKIYKCTTCEQSFRLHAELGRHYQQMHGQRYLSCLACGVTFRDITNLYKHEKRCIAPDATLVLKARAKVIKPKGPKQIRPFLQQPQKTEKKQKPRPPSPGTPRKRFSCSFCPAQFCGKLAWKGHENMHRGERPYRCQTCLAPYATYSALNRHRLTHSDQPNVCDLCGKQFTTKYTLRAHQDTHNPERKYACPECPKRFAQNCALLLHVRRQHLNLPPPVACRLCPKRFGKNSVLKVHMRNEHGMELITRNMFIKSMSRLTEMELEQAKVVMKSEVDEFPEIVVTNKDKFQAIVDDEGKQGDVEDPLAIKRKMRKKPIKRKKRIENPSEPIEISIANDEDRHENEDINYIDGPQYTIEANEVENETGSGANQIIVDISDTRLTFDVLQFVQKLQIDAAAENREVKIVLVENGTIAHIINSEEDAQKLIDQLPANEQKDVRHKAIVANYTGPEIGEGTYCLMQCDDTNDDECVVVNDVREGDSALTEVKFDVDVEDSQNATSGNESDIETIAEKTDDISETNEPEGQIDIIIEVEEQKCNIISTQQNPTLTEANLDDIQNDSLATEDIDIDKKSNMTKETNIKETTIVEADKCNNNKNLERIKVELEVEHVSEYSDSSENMHEMDTSKTVVASDASHSEDDSAQKVVVAPLTPRRSKRTPKKNEV